MLDFTRDHGRYLVKSGKKNIDQDNIYTELTVPLNCTEVSLVSGVV